MDKVFQDVLAENAQLDLERLSAPDLLAELASLAPSQRRLRVRNSTRYRAWPLMEEALDRCRKTWSEDPVEAEGFATLALDVADEFAPEGYREALLSDARAEIWSHIGNCKRIQSDFHAAHEAFARAARFLVKGTGDSQDRARFLDLKASLLGDQHDFKAATACISEACELYGRLPDRHAQGRALLKYASILGKMGEPQKAVKALGSAEKLIDFQREPRLRFLVKWDLAINYRDSDQLAEAQSVLAEARELSRALGTRHDRLRLLWMEGNLRGMLGQIELAEEMLSQVREAFIDAGIGNDVALASLDLAVLYLQAGRTEDVRRLAIETMPIFASRGVQREFLMAWELFRAAAEREVATLGLVRDVAAKIRSFHDVSDVPGPDLIR